MALIDTGIFQSFIHTYGRLYNYSAYGVRLNTNFYRIDTTYGGDYVVGTTGSTYNDVDVYSDDLIYILGDSHRVYKTTNKGVTITSLGTPAIGINPLTIGVKSVGYDKIYSATYNSTGGTIQYSSDSGATWNQKLLTPSASGNFIFGVDATKVSTGSILCAAVDGVYVDLISNGYATVSKKVIEVGVKFWDVCCDNTNVGTMYAVGGATADTTTRIYKSTDSGANWVFKYSGTPVGSTYFKTCKCLNNELWVLSDSSVLFKSTDSGANLTDLGVGLPLNFCIKGAGPNAANEVLYSNFEKTFYSSDSGTTFTQILNYQFEGKNSMDFKYI